MVTREVLLQKIKGLFTAVAVIILLLAPSGSAYALTPTFNNHKYIGGVGNVTVWLNYGSGVGYWSSYITNARNNWMYPGWDNPIYMNFVSSNYGSKMDFHRNNDAYFGGGMSILAWTMFFNSSSQSISPYSGNWLYTEIHINHDMYSQPSISNDMALGTTIHEMGHAFGLAHANNNPHSIMCQTAYGRIAQRVQKVDNDTVNVLY